MALAVRRVARLHFLQITAQKRRRLRAVFRFQHGDLADDLLPDDLRPQRRLDRVFPLDLFTELQAGIMAAVKRQKHSVRQAALIAEDDIDLPLIQLAQQIGRQRDRRGFDHQNGYFAQVNALYAVGIAHDEIVHFVIQLGQAGHRYDPPAHGFSVQKVGTILIQAGRRLVDKIGRLDALQ